MVPNVGADDGYADIASAYDRAEEIPGVVDDALLARELLNDLGNARRLQERYGLDLAWVKEWGWGAWDGKRWSFEDGEARALIAAHRTAEAMFEEAVALNRTFDDPEPAKPAGERKKATDAAEVKAWDTWEAWDKRRRRHVATVAEMQKFALESGDRGRSSAMLATAAPYLRRRHDEFDAEAGALNVANGTLRLDGERVALYEPRRRDFSTRSATVEYRESADVSPKWQRFIAEIFPGQADVALMFQRWLGYCLSGSIAEQRAVILEGAGSNGKSVAMNVVAQLLGDYVTTVPVETFLHQERKSGSGPSPDIARLAGVRLVRTSEPEPGSRLSESTLKQYTGGENMVARRLHKDFFEFKPRGKLTMSVNVRPVIVGKDHGIKRRLLVVPFTRIFSKEEIIEADRVRGCSLESDLLTEGPGILRWLIDGYLMWREDGLQPPKAVMAATDAYFAEMDPIGQFIREACRVIADGVGVTDTTRERSVDLFATYKRWCDANNEEPKTNTAFGRRLNDLGIRSVKVGGIGFRSGVEIKAEWRGPAAAADGTD